MSIKGKDYTVENREIDGANLSITKILTPQAEIKYGRAQGTYTSLTGIDLRSSKSRDIVSHVLEETLQDYIEQSNMPLKKILTVGIGNGRYFIDSLGPKTCNKLTEMQSQVKTYKPSTFGRNGVITADAVAEKTKKVKQSHTILVDSTATESPSRLHSLQFLTTGLEPGKGSDVNSRKIATLEQVLSSMLGSDEERMNEMLEIFGYKSIDEFQTYINNLKNSSKKINSSLLGTPVLSIGVPVMMKHEAFKNERCVQAVENGPQARTRTLGTRKFTIDAYGNVVPKDTSLTRDAISFYSETIAKAIDKTDRQLR